MHKHAGEFSGSQPLTMRAPCEYSPCIHMSHQVAALMLSSRKDTSGVLLPVGQFLWHYFMPELIDICTVGMLSLSNSVTQFLKKAQYI